MNHKYKKNKKVELIETAYLNNMYDHHPSGEAKILNTISNESWKESLVPLYKVEINNITYTVPEYSISEIDKRKK